MSETRATLTECASYGLDPRVHSFDYQAAVDHAVIDALRAWSAENDGKTLLPTGIRARNLNPIFTSQSEMTLGWWGYIVDGATARFPSINTKSERLATGKGAIGSRAIVPASYWREFQKPNKALHHLALPDGDLLGFAAVTRCGRTMDGQEFTCYSLVMQPAADQIAGIHDRMPLLVPAGFAEEWLTSSAPAAQFIDAARNAAQPLAASIIGARQGAAAEPLF